MRRYDKARYPKDEERVHDAEAGDVRCGHTKVAIIGTGPDRDGAPFHDPEWCVWALNEIPQPSLTRHFELHPMNVQSAADLVGLSRIGQPCYVLDLEDAKRARGASLVSGGRQHDLLFRGVPNPVRFPLERVRLQGSRFHATDYFTCTFAYQVALALDEGFDEVGLWGVGLYNGTARERLIERACVDYWLGVLDGRGVKVAYRSLLSQHEYPYGYDYQREMDRVNAVVDTFVLVRKHGG